MRTVSRRVLFSSIVGASAAVVTGCSCSRVSDPLPAAEYMTAMMGSKLATFDQWAWHYHNISNDDRISPARMEVIIELGGGDRKKLITASQFLKYVVETKPV